MTIPVQQPVPSPPRRTLRTVLIVAGVVLVLCCGGAVAGGFFLFRTVQDATGPAREATDAFITDLESGRATAYDRLCASTQSQFTRDAFAQGLARQPKVRSHEIDGVSVSNVNGRVSGTVTAQLTLDTGFIDKHAFTLVKEDGQWKVCGRPY